MSEKIERFHDWEHDGRRYPVKLQIPRRDKRGGRYLRHSFFFTHEEAYDIIVQLQAQMVETYDRS